MLYLSVINIIHQDRYSDCNMVMATKVANKTNKCCEIKYNYFDV